MSPMATARTTGISHPTRLPYMRTNAITILARIHLHIGIYLSIPVRITMTNAIFDPLTTRICVIPAFVNDFLVSLERSSILPIVIPRTIPAIFSGNPLKITHLAHFCTAPRVPISPRVIRLNIATVLLPYIRWYHAYPENHLRGRSTTFMIFPVYSMVSPIQMRRLLGISRKIPISLSSICPLFPVDLLAILAICSRYVVERSLVYMI